MALNSNRPSAVDVARRAGVSRTQVSYVLNNTKAEHVSSENREKILAAARELGYQPHQSAQALRRGFANEFALFFPAPYTNRINGMLGSIHELGLADGCIPVQYSFNSYHEPARKQEAFRSLLARRPRGLFLSLFDVTMEDIRYAQSLGVDRILLYDIESHLGFPTLVLPVEAIGFLAAQHLLFRGHQRISVLKPSDPIQTRAYELRLEGMRRALATCSDAQLIELPWPADDLRPTSEGARRFIEQHRIGRGEASCLYTFSDEYAFPLIAKLLDAGIRIPEHIALLGSDDIPFASLIRPALTTIAFDKDSLGRRAVSMINALITGESLGLEDQRPLGPQLVLRETT